MGGALSHALQGVELYSTHRAIQPASIWTLSVRLTRPSVGYFNMSLSQGTDSPATRPISRKRWIGPPFPSALQHGSGSGSREPGPMSSVRTRKRHQGLETIFGGTLSALSGGQLQELFLGRRAEAGEQAFSTLVERHGPMVHRVCGQVVGDCHEALDAFHKVYWCRFVFRGKKEPTPIKICGSPRGAIPRGDPARNY